MCILVIIGVVLLVMVLFLLMKKEHFGPVKSQRSIPIDSCENICDSYYTKCINDWGTIDFDYCNQIKRNCVYECYYSPYQRI
jgi:hypothetical protein